MTDHANIVRDGLRCARNDNQLLDGRDFDEAFWDGKDAALDALVARIRELEAENARLKGGQDAS